MLKDKEAYNAYMKDYMLRRYHKRREDAIKQLGGSCISCGSTKDLEFDHVDPQEKDFSMAKGSSFSNARWQEELAKCQLLCCHTEKHESKYPCGTPQSYWAGCTCKECTAANTRHNKEYKNNRK